MQIQTRNVGWPLLSIALASMALALAGCNSREEGTAVTFAAVLHSGRAAGTEALPEEAALPRTFATDLGLQVTLEEAWVTLSGVELVPCAEVGWRRLLRGLAPIGVAHAHGELSPTQTGTPHVLSAGTEDLEAFSIGHLSPPAGDYCRIRLLLSPADDDAEDLPDETFVGVTARLAGHFVPAGGGPSAPFSVTTAGSATAERVLADAPGGGLTLSLSQEHLTGAVTFGLVYARWLEGLDLAAAETDGSRAALLQNLLSSVELVPEIGAHAHP